jgi:hypothetical protein
MQQIFAGMLFALKGWQAITACGAGEIAKDYGRFALSHFAGAR